MKVVGRLSRDELYKHHPQDAAYRSLLHVGLEIRIMGGTQLAPFLPRHDRLTLLPALAMPPQPFIHSLDLFLYRRSLWAGGRGGDGLWPAGCLPPGWRILSSIGW